MAKSSLYTQLDEEIERLRVNFLPLSNPTQSYSEKELDHARAFSILAHAEIEYYIENILLDIIRDKHKDMIENKKASFILMCLFASSKVGWQDHEDLPERLAVPKFKDEDTSVLAWMKKSFEQYEDIVKKNHGIKRANLKRLIMPLGIDMSDFDQVWLNNIRTFA